MPNAVGGLKGDNSLIGNGQDIVLVYGETINNYPNSLKEIKFKEIEIPYLVTGNINIYGRNDYKIVMTIEPGVEIRFNKNTEIYLYGVSSTTSIDAKYNWWGDITGPLDDSDDRRIGGWYNPKGKRDKVTNKVDYSEWRTPLLDSIENMVWRRK